MLKPQATHMFKNLNGCSILADVYLPEHAKPPVVLYLHGGALILGTRKFLSPWQARLLLRAGFAVVSADYRLAPETKLPEIATDVQDAIRWARGAGALRYGFDPTHVAVFGGSAGGYLSLLSGTFEVKPDVIVSFYGYGDILGEWLSRPSEYYCQQPFVSRTCAEAVVGRRERSTGGSNRNPFYLYCRQQGTWPQAVSGWDLEADRRLLLRYCPAYQLGPDYPPTMLLHGDHDTDVPVEQSIQMAEALARKGIEHRLEIFPGLGHDFDRNGRDTRARQTFEQVVQFIEDHV